MLAEIGGDREVRLLACQVVEAQICHATNPWTISARGELPGALVLQFRDIRR